MKAAGAPERCAPVRALRQCWRFRKRQAARCRERIIDHDPGEDQIPCVKWVLSLIALSATTALVACGAPDSRVSPGAGGAGAAGTAGGAAGVGGIPPAPVAPGVFPLAGTDADLPTSDLEVLRNAIGDRAVVGLGESVHTSAGYYRMKSRIVRYLVDEVGFRAIALETEWGLARVATDYVANCKGTSRAATKSFLSVFQDVALQELLEWLCARNKAHPEDPVVFWGFDTQQPYADASALRDFFATGAPHASNVVAGISACNGGSTSSQAEYTASGDGALYSSASYPEERHTNCLSALDALDAYLQSNEITLAGATSHEQWSLAKIASRSLRAWEGQAYAGTRRKDEAYAARDAGMADVFLALRELKFPAARSVVWGHNTHLAIDQFKMVPAFVTAPMLGTHLAARLGSDWFPIAFAGYEVKINWPGYPTPPLPTGPAALEVMLHDLGVDYAFVPLQGPDSLFLAQNQRVTITGREQLPAEHFRALIFLDESPAMTYVK